MNEDSSAPLRAQLKDVFPGMNGLDLWDFVNNVVMISWALLVFLPRWKWTPMLSLIAIIFDCATYTSGMIMTMLFSDAGFVEGTEAMFSFEGVVNLFANPNVVFLGWVHYLALDCLVGRMILLDSVHLGVSTLFHIFVMIPCLVVTLMLAPAGFLLYMIIRNLFLSPKESIGLPASFSKIKAA